MIRVPRDEMIHLVDTFAGIRAYVFTFVTQRVIKYLTRLTILLIITSAKTLLSSSKKTLFLNDELFTNIYISFNCNST